MARGEPRQQSHTPRQASQRAASAATAAAKSTAPNLPSVTLPKGGGAIRGIGEKFATNPVTGTGTVTIPVATSPGRAGFGPELSLRYDSGAGNGPFGLGWSLSLPSIARKTDKGLPRYQDAAESDVFLLSGAEDLVPVLVQSGSDWVAEAAPDRTLGAASYKIKRYRPRIEGLFARIERWSSNNDPTDVFWRSISKDNITSWYGRTRESRISDPDDQSRIFSWLICSSYDDKGNAIRYQYREEGSDGIDLTQAHERNRTPETRQANRYLKRIKYGNRTPNRDSNWKALDPATVDDQDWMFEVLFDYGEGHYSEADPDSEQRVFVSANPSSASTTTRGPVRGDPFSSYRAGFELRSYRLCRRVLMFHRFPNELGWPDYLVRSTEFTYRESPLASSIESVVQSGFVRKPDGTYLKKSLPPVEFGYSRATIQSEVQSVDATSLENLPGGLSGDDVHWLDLDGEGLPGVLTEQAEGWAYKRNLSPLEPPEEGSKTGRVRFGAAEPVPARPSLTGGGAGRTQFLDLAGDGQVDVVTLDGPVSGYHERTLGGGWKDFVPFGTLPNLDWSDPNLRFVDLTGDGHADVLITEQDAFSWHPSLGEAGFGSSQCVPQALEEEAGPRLVFSDGTESIYLTDLSGDGLTDLARIRNGEICYWPNLGYGRFGRKVTMDNAPVFEPPDLFDQRRVRLSDIDGSGTTDILYLGSGGVTVWRNEAGNRWSPADHLAFSPWSDNVTSVVVADLLGNGTACLVWSSLLPSDAKRQMRYVDLMGGQKPHLLVSMKNNLGAETRVHYAPSTRFYLADREAGRPWITRLPFPVHVVERVETYDHLSGNRFISRSAYHHGYFDGEEREFRGFGMVERWDTEELGVFNATPPDGTNADPSSHVPPVLTRTWFHTGSLDDAKQVSRQFAAEYYGAPTKTDPNYDATLDAFSKTLLPDTILPDHLSLGELHEACRALKGSMLRQEVYGIDGTTKETQPYTVTEQNQELQPLQPRGSNRHAVFYPHPRESITYHYEREADDPRVAHTLALEVDRYGNTLKSAAIAYGRRRPNLALSVMDQAVQDQTLITYTENRFTNALSEEDDQRTPLESESRTYEVTGLTLTGGQHHYTLGQISGVGAAAVLLDYEKTPTSGVLQKRVIDHGRTYYRRNDLAGLLPLGEIQSMALPGEGFQLAFTPGLIEGVFEGRVTDTVFEAEGRYVHTEGDTSWWVPSGRSFYSFDPTHTASQELSYAREHFFLPHRYRDPFHTDTDSTERFVKYDPHDLLVEETRDALGNRVTVGERHTDPTQPLVRGGQDYRVLQPALVMDPNRNRSEVVFDALGMVVGTAVMGKPPAGIVEGDSLAGFAPDPTQAEIDEFLLDPRGPVAATLLASATSRVVYDLTRHWREQDVSKRTPTVAATIVRETHAADLRPGHPSKLQVSLSYSDGFGREIQRKGQAEPGPVPRRDADGTPVLDVNGQPELTSHDVDSRWVASGWTVFNNKGKPVRQYEPFFTDTHLFEFEVKIGVSPVLFYDPAERVVATLHSNHTWEKVVFDAWQQTTYDVNDTCAPHPGELTLASPAQTGDPRTDPDIRGLTSGYFRTVVPTWQTWHAQRIGGALGPQEREAAERSTAHANTPTTLHLDALGRPFLTVTHNRIVCAGHALDGTEDSVATRITLDIEGNERAVRDERRRPVGYLPTGAVERRIVMRYDYDMLGNLVHRLSMEAGARWLLHDVGGQVIRSWDSRGHHFVSTYDVLRRPVEQNVRGTTADSDPRTLNRTILVEKTEYGEGQPHPEALNLRTRIFRTFDSAGVATMAGLTPGGAPEKAYDFKGNVLCSSRQLVSDYEAIPDWNAGPQVEAETFEATTMYDALNRPIQSVAPHSSLTRATFNVTQPRYNEAGLLESLDVWLARSTKPVGLLDPSREAPSPVGVTNIDYDAKGRRQHIDYRNGVSTSYGYDPHTFRLTRLITRRGAARFPGDDPQPNIADWPGRHLQNLHYTYDPAGNITHIRDAAQQTIFFRNRRVDPDNDYTYDALYRLIQARGREHLGQTGGKPVPHSYNDAPRVGIHWSANDGNAMGTYVERYVYDAVGNFLQMQHKGTDPGHPGWTRAYGYLEPSQIEGGAAGVPPKASNRLSHTSTTQSGLGSPLNRSYLHDHHGNMVRMPHLGGGSAGPNLHWDYRDQLRQSDMGGGGAVFYVYDSAGQRMRKVWEKSPGQVEERIYLGGFEIYRKRSGTARLERETLHIMDDQERVALVDTRTLDTAGNVSGPARLIRYQIANHLGSVGLELDDGGGIISYEEHTPYGSTSYQGVKRQTKSAAKRYRYTGLERDEEAGFSYHGARYYAPWLGRWMGADPIGLADGVNLFGYVGSNPMVFVDRGGTQAGGCIGNETAAVCGDGTILRKGRGFLSISPDPTGDGKGSQVVVFAAETVTSKLRLRMRSSGDARLDQAIKEEFDEAGVNVEMKYQRFFELPPDQSLNPLDATQGALDIVGLVPGPGEAADLLNASISLARGKYVDASLSAAAAIPFIGWSGAAGKVLRKTRPGAKRKGASGRAGVDMSVLTSREAKMLKTFKTAYNRERQLIEAEGKFVDFSPYAHPFGDVNIGFPRGSRSADFAAAWKESGIDPKDAKGWTWHHDADFGRLILVPTEVHSEIGHWGGISILRAMMKKYD